MDRVKQAFEEITASIHEAAVSEFPQIVGELERLKALIQVRMLNGQPASSRAGNLCFLIPGII